MLCGVLCMGICMSVQGQETKKYPEPAPMQPEMSEFWTPQPQDRGSSRYGSSHYYTAIRCDCIVGFGCREC